MTGYRIGLVKLRNFFAFRKVEHDFSAPGLTVVTGEIRGHAGCSSNGAGKSALLEAPLWAITGQCMRARYRGDSVVRKGSKRGCRVEVMIHGPSEIRVVRYRGDVTHGNKVFLYVDGKDVSRGRNDETDSAIQAELGLDFSTFMNTIAFGAREDVKSFFASPDSDRKRILERLLGLEVFERAHAIAQQRRRELATAIDVPMSKEIDVGLDLQSKRSAIAALTRTPVATDAERKKLALRVAKTRKEVQNCEVLVTQLISEMSVLESSHVKAVQAYDKACDLRAREASRLRSAAETHRSHSVAALREARNIDTALKRIASLSGHACPTCLQDIDDGFATSPAAAVLRKQKAKLEKESAEEANLADELAAQESDLPKITPPSTSSIDKIKEKIKVATNRVALARAEWQTEKARRDVTEAHVAKVESELQLLRADEDRLLKEQAALNAERAEIQSRMDRLTFWIEAFSNSGVKSFVIETELPAINLSATRIAQRLLCAGTEIELRATRALQSRDEEKEEMTIRASIPGCASTYDGASRGQKQRLNLALILAMGNVVAARNASPFDQLFADEVFDGVDAAGVDSVVEIVREISARCPVTLVTHDERLQSVGDRRVHVLHDGKVAILATK